MGTKRVRKAIIKAIMGAMVLAACAGLGAPVHAQNAPPAAAPAPQLQPTPDSIAAAKDLLAIVNKDTVRLMVTQLTEKIWPSIEQKLRSADAKIDDGVIRQLRGEFERIQLEYLSAFMNDLPELYARYFTAAEMRDIIAFYNTPTGAKSLRLMPQIASDSIGKLLPRMPGIQQSVMEAFTKVLRQKGIAI